MKNLKTQLSVTVLPPDIVGDVIDEEMIEEDLIPINDMVSWVITAFLIIILLL